MTHIGLLYLCLTFIVAPALTASDIYQNYYAESLHIAQSMTVEELLGQMIQADF